MSTPGEKTAADAAARRADGPRPGWGERAGWALAVVGPLSSAPVSVDPKEITAHREEWLNTWTEAVGK